MRIEIVYINIYIIYIYIFYLPFSRRFAYPPPHESIFFVLLIRVREGGGWLRMRIEPPCRSQTRGGALHECNNLRHVTYVL